jgi:hypothetical protein
MTQPPNLARETLIAKERAHRIASAMLSVCDESGISFANPRATMFNILLAQIEMDELVIFFKQVWFASITP